jgi:hypothetical protein
MALFFGQYSDVQSAFDFPKGVIGPDSPADSDLLYTSKFFESYNNLPNTTFIHGLNLLRTCGDSRESLKIALRVARRYLDKKRLAFELGNEPESHPHACIPPNTEAAKTEPLTREKYVQAWRTVAQDLVEDDPQGGIRFIGPSMANAAFEFDAWGAYENGIENGSFLKEFASHR